jgi:hypothetical protein
VRLLDEQSPVLLRREPSHRDEAKTLLGWDPAEPGTAVAHLDVDRVPPGHDPDLDDGWVAAVGGGAHGVLDQVAHRSSQTHRVGPRAQPGLADQTELALLRQRDRVPDRGHSLADVDQDRSLIGRMAGDDLLHPADLVQHLVETVADHRPVQRLMVHDGRQHHDRAQRLPQIVTQPPLRPVRPCFRTPHCPRIAGYSRHSSHHPTQALSHAAVGIDPDAIPCCALHSASPVAR